MLDAMERINYQHLLYFWMVAREGGLVAAGKVLHLSHPTLSAQIHSLEDHLGVRLFEKAGRKLVLTEMGHVVLRYANEIFTLGSDMLETVRSGGQGQPLRLVVGVADVVPKLVVRRLLKPALSLSQPVRLICREDSYDKLLADLGLHALDMVISDAPVPPGSTVRAFNHLLGETAVTFFGTKSLVKTYKKGFPRSLHGAPVLLPLDSLALRRALNLWFSRHGIEPHIVGEFEDSALLKVFGSDGVGLFAAPSVVEREVMEQYGVERLGELPVVRERFYAITMERQLKHVAVMAILDAARQEVFRAR